MHKNTINLIGQRFGKLVVTSKANNNAAGRVCWNLKCDCDNIVKSTATVLRLGQATSCGCGKADRIRQMARSNTKHGLSKTPEFRIWSSMIHRCTNSDSRYFANYGGRGIKVCDEWLNSFTNFLNDMSERPSKEHQLDRIDNDDDYRPGNCRWTTRLINMNNRRCTPKIEYNGQSLTKSEHARLHGLKPQLVFQRVASGWDIERALTTPAVFSNGYNRIVASATCE